MPGTQTLAGCLRVRIEVKGGLALEGVEGVEGDLAPLIDKPRTGPDPIDQQSPRSKTLGSLSRRPRWGISRGGVEPLDERLPAIGINAETGPVC